MFIKEKFFNLMVRLLMLNCGDGDMSRLSDQDGPSLSRLSLPFYIIRHYIPTGGGPLTQKQKRPLCWESSLSKPFHLF